MSTLTALIILVALAPSEARAASAQAGSSEVDVELVSQPPWHRAKDELGLRLRVTNNSATALNGFRVQIAAYDRLTSRSALYESFDGVSEGALSLITVLEHKSEVAPGQSITVQVDDPVSRLESVDVEGIYPLEISICDVAACERLDSLVTELVYYPSEVETPLNMVLVVPVNELPSRAPDGAYHQGPTGDFPPLTDAVSSSDGWLRGLLGALRDEVESKGGFDVGVAPSPRLVEELADLAEGFVRAEGDRRVNEGASSPGAVAAREVLDELRALLEQGGVEPLLTPYAPVDLPTLARRFDLTELSRQLSVGEVVLDDLLPQVAFEPGWLFAPGGRWDETTLDEVATASANTASRTFFSSSSFEQPITETSSGCPVESSFALTFTCSIDVRTEQSATSGYVMEPGIEDRLQDLTNSDDIGLDLQRLFAETAMIHLELPGEERRIVQATLPALWHPGPALSRRLFEGLADAPWIRTITPTEGLQSAPSARRRQLVDVAPALTEDPGDPYYKAVEAADRALDTFSDVEPPLDLLQRLRRNMLVAQSRIWWTDEAARATGLSYATDTRARIENELDRVNLNILDTTLTSRRSLIGMDVLNNAPYPVTVDVELISSDITIDEDEIDELREITIEAGGGERLEVEAVAESSGIFAVDARIETPDTGETIDSVAFTVRSTNFNQIALALTFGALAFLIFFYAWHVIQRRRGRASGRASAATE
jgi:hypothetical protein